MMPAMFFGMMAPLCYCAGLSGPTDSDLRMVVILEASLLYYRNKLINNVPYLQEFWHLPVQTRTRPRDGLDMDWGQVMAALARAKVQTEYELRNLDVVSMRTLAGIGIAGSDEGDRTHSPQMTQFFTYAFMLAEFVPVSCVSDLRKLARRFARGTQWNMPEDASDDLVEMNASVVKAVLLASSEVDASAPAQCPSLVCRLQRLALASSQHARLGAKSVLAMLDVDTLARVVKFLPQYLVSVHVEPFVREDGKLAPHNKYHEDLGMMTRIDAANALTKSNVLETHRRFGNFEARDGKWKGFGERAGDGDAFMTLPIASDHQFFIFPASVGPGRGWNGNYTATITAVLDGGTRLTLGRLKWVCFQDGIEWDSHRCDLDRIELEAWAVSAGFEVGGTYNWNCPWCLLPSAGFVCPQEPQPELEVGWHEAGQRHSTGIDYAPTPRPILDFITGFSPAKTCKQYVLQDAAEVLPEV
eukprot:COSAG01_NODE_14495_length_1446_cov_1.562732_1_plen_470_part_01